MQITRDQSQEQMVAVINPIYKRLRSRSAVETCGRCDGTGFVFWSSVKGGVRFGTDTDGAEITADSQAERDQCG